jgi:hypothetical protein
MSIEEIIYKISDNFSVSWDPEEISKDFPTIEQADQSPYFDPSGKTHWQLYATDIVFGRNFYRNHKVECEEVAEKLKVIQTQLRNDKTVPINYLTETFLNHEILAGRVNLLKTIPGKDIKLHNDSRRDLCINIGLKNSNKWVTVISKDPDIKNFESSQKNTFLMNDGDAYIILINNPHTAKCLNKSDILSTRFLITYTMTNHL